ncbi:hypothetical protein D3C86_1156650 [compost metagenome]
MRTAQVFTGYIREAIHHGIVTFFHTGGIHCEVLAGLVGLIVAAVGSRFVICTCIHTEDAEIAGLAWPHPVVGIAAELTDAVWREAHQAYIIIFFQYRNPVFITVVKRFYLGCKAQ